MPTSQPTGRELPRHEARTRALEVLYERNIKDISPEELLDSLTVPLDPFSLDIFKGVCRYSSRIDQLLDNASQGWHTDRMPLMDRLILQMATYELLAHRETSDAVILDEAVELAKEYSTDQSGKFVNGVLSSLAGIIRAKDKHL